eukprot:CAMPEP_0194299394 /NCGR_PEP_ID=MMETSP0169-20130528/60696_1 /TAXON_ID=218684 /ORGANISM="Corethron pennatum, Strain L29A3" /LENGTH=540 /DNA_ID=CAMNT_0039049487 /DNA_START=538 /DNA_END=2157 /DNA_ORIENTATION=+
MVEPKQVILTQSNREELTSLVTKRSHKNYKKNDFHHDRVIHENFILDGTEVISRLPQSIFSVNTNRRKIEGRKEQGYKGDIVKSSMLLEEEMNERIALAEISERKNFEVELRNMGGRIAGNNDHKVKTKTKQIGIENKREDESPELREIFQLREELRVLKSKVMSNSSSTFSKVLKEEEPQMNDKNSSTHVALSDNSKPFGISETTERHGNISYKTLASEESLIDSNDNNMNNDTNMYDNMNRVDSDAASQPGSNDSKDNKMNDNTGNDSILPKEDKTNNCTTDLSVTGKCSKSSDAKNDVLLNHTQSTNFFPGQLLHSRSVKIKNKVASDLTDTETSTGGKELNICDHLVGNLEDVSLKQEEEQIQNINNNEHSRNVFRKHCKSLNVLEGSAVDSTPGFNAKPDASAARYLSLCFNPELANNLSAHKIYPETEKIKTNISEDRFFICNQPSFLAKYVSCDTPEVELFEERDVTQEIMKENTHCDTKDKQVNKAQDLNETPANVIKLVLKELSEVSSRVVSSFKQVRERKEKLRSLYFLW